MVKIIKVTLPLIFIFFYFFNRSTNISLKLSDYNTSNRNIMLENYYDMLLQIPKINLEKEIYNIGKKENNINQNVMLLYDGYTTIIVAHSGNNYNAYFKDLNKLNISDKVILYKENLKYIYKVNSIFYYDKNIAFALKKEYSDKLLLITCLNKKKYLIVECSKDKIINL